MLLVQAHFVYVHIFWSRPLHFSPARTRLLYEPSFIRIYLAVYDIYTVTQKHLGMYSVATVIVCKFVNCLFITELYWSLEVKDSRHASLLICFIWSTLMTASSKLLPASSSPVELALEVTVVAVTCAGAHKRLLHLGCAGSARPAAVTLSTRG